MFQIGIKWNEPSIRFYRLMGARSLDDWTTYRVGGDAFKALAGWGMPGLP
jgi:hypothetical protein